MTFPVSPTNGQKANVNGVTYTYNSTLTAWTVSSNFLDGISANLVAANAITSVSTVVAGSTISATGNITGGNLLGTIRTAAQPNITSVGSLTALTVTGTTSAGQINPSTNNSFDLGTTTLRWRNIYTNDLNLSNGIGDYTIVEGEQDLFLYNNKSNKVYKFALIEVDPESATPKIDQLNKNL